MISVHYAAIFGGVFAMASAVSPGYQAMIKLSTPPPITGSAQYLEPVTPGQVVKVAWSIKKDTSCPGYLARAWAGDGGFILTEPLRVATLPVGTADYNVQTVIPEFAQSGALEMSIVGFYQCEGQHRQPFKLGPVDFTVTEKEAG